MDEFGVEIPKTVQERDNTHLYIITDHNNQVLTSKNQVKENIGNQIGVK